MISDLEVKDFLEHHGVKGQKWGVRNKKNKRPLTKQERIKRNKRRQTIVKNSVTVGLLGLYSGYYVASLLSSRGSTRTHNIKVNKPKTVTDLINEQRNIKVDSMKRMHKEGKMDAEQAKNFLKILNDRYDRKIVDATKVA